MASESSCNRMAYSLRKLLQMKYEQVYGVHFKYDVFDRIKFQNTIDKSWNWLDGQSLIST